MSDLITAPSINTVGGLDAASVFPVTNAAGATLYQASGADIAAAYGGGGGGGSDLIAIAYALTSSGSLAISSPTDVPGLSVTFSLGASEVLIVNCAGMLFRSGGSGTARIALNVDGSDYHPVNANENWYATYQNENGVYHYNASWIVPLAAGSHTIKIRASDAMAVQNTDFWSRQLTVRQV